LWCLFGKINELKYRKPRDGLNVIDPGMGNPTDTRSPLVIGKLCEAARDERNHRYSVSHMCQEVRSCRLPALLASHLPLHGTVGSGFWHAEGLPTMKCPAGWLD
jgi:hypothetical protein